MCWKTHMEIVWVFCWVLAFFSAKTHTYVLCCGRQARVGWEQHEAVFCTIYLIAWPPTVMVTFKSNTKCFLSCSKLANLPGGPWRWGKQPNYPAVRPQSTFINLSIMQWLSEWLSQHRTPATSPAEFGYRTVFSRQTYVIAIRPRGGNGVTLLQVCGCPASDQAEERMFDTPIGTPHLHSHGGVKAAMHFGYRHQLVQLGVYVMCARQDHGTVHNTQLLQNP